MNKCCKFGIPITLVLLAIAAYWMHVQFDLFKNDVYDPLNSCKEIESPPGPEDLQDFGRFLISAYDDRLKSFVNKTRLLTAEYNGGLMSIDSLTGKVAKLRLENFPEKKTFHPVGLSIYKNASVYVINTDSGKKQDLIEIFRIREENDEVKVSYEKTLSFKEHYFHQLNDIHVIDHEEIYVSIFKSEPEDLIESTFDEIKSTLVTLFGKQAHILHCRFSETDHKCIIEGSGQSMNGIASDGKILLAADTFGGVIHQYEIMENHSLKKVVQFDSELKGDNIAYDPITKKFYLAGFRLKDMLKGISDVKAGILPQIPAGVVELSQQNGKWETKLLFMQNRQSGTSTAIRMGNKLIMGSSVDSKIFICPIQ